MENKQSLPILFPLGPEEFYTQIRRIVQEELAKIQASSAIAEEEEPLLDRKEVARRLRISLVTLTDWVKRGLPAHKQRGKVYFLHSEVMAYIQHHHWKKVLQLPEESWGQH